VQRLEFTVEPFVEGSPGPHVRAAVAAIEALGVVVEFGPFGSTCVADDATMPHVVEVLSRASFDNGATHLSINLERIPGPGTVGTVETVETVETAP
jgi:uncharacterized protein YqgV (UPF0045/DUF77 family)